MAVKNRLKDVLIHLLGEEITAYRVSKMTGLGNSTVLRVLNNPDWYPDKSTMEAICKTFRIQPADFLYYEED